MPTTPKSSRKPAGKGKAPAKRKARASVKRRQANAKPKPSFRTEAEEVLRAADAPMHVRDITAAVLERGKLKVGGKTPDATLAAVMLRSPRFKKTAPGTFCLEPEVQS